MLSYAYLHNSRILFAVTAFTKLFDGGKSIKLFSIQGFPIKLFMNSYQEILKKSSSIMVYGKNPVHL